MQMYSAFDYVLMDLAVQWGEDKKTFPERLDWAKEHFQNFETMSEERGHWKEKPLFNKGVLALRKIQQGIPVGHMIGLDAICSGMQMLSVLTGCYEGAKSTGLVDPDVRADAYTRCTQVMRRYLPNLPASAREAIKQACMTALYGSQAEPKKLFGDGTPELAVFYKALAEIAPGAFGLLGTFTSAWRANAMDHSWILPDIHHVRVPVMVAMETQIEVDELNHATFTYNYEKNMGQPKGISLIANVTHSVDAYVLRTLHRRCNYDFDQMARAQALVQGELLARDLATEDRQTPAKALLEPYLDRFKASLVSDISIVQHLNRINIQQLNTLHLSRLAAQISQIMSVKPFPVVFIHDEFKAHPNHLNTLRWHYREIMAELAESNLLNDILHQITGLNIQIPKQTNDLSNYIRESEYGIC